MVLLFGLSHELPPFWPRTDLTMTNNLGGPVLTVHCKSKDNDLGVHMVAAKTDYHFSFQPNIWKTTLFFCSFQWNNQVKQFDIFDAPRDQDDGYKFNWTIKPDGPCKLGEFSESKDGVVSLATFPDIHPDSREELFGQRIHPSCMSQPLSAYLRRRSQLQHWITEFSKSSDDKTLQNHQPLFHHLIHPFQNNHQLDYLQAPEHLISDKVRFIYNGGCGRVERHKGWCST
uniref:S-protein homolog n=1 Tax=Brassica oleracea var. oleracea TaxID=109376 RepID=A0A0D3DIV3_BRAOL